ncbi:hypothetical protein [Xylophilus ampelinus]|uniref:Uncharacterized protein n=1 Tax=Xylophilus ampelinus TaxID=54067 RepID=A0A318SGL3_9BURK|nr:hypothetical protein [Xylophilus ampelinus]MCS4511799.1 hypothetical protein [Xylophilus ampelinus]PYE73411.1 hypothetical protein DFQ15_13515 [Xylophilus ampelinus]
MDNFIAGVVRFLLRLALVAMAAVLAVCLLFMAAVLLSVWGVRRIWARIAGKPVPAWHMGFDPGTRFKQAFSSAGRWSPRGASSARKDVVDGEVTDVEARELPVRR